jgi:RimJ/RimL family protein N-acetyltransferase
MSLSSNQTMLAAQRERIRPLLVPTDPSDGMTAYYALTHDPRRTRLTLHRTPAGGVDGFVAVCQTGRDLFVPLVVMRAREDDVAELLRQALQQGRPYTVVTQPELRSGIEDVLLAEHQQVNQVHVLQPESHRPVINVMVQPGQSAFRYEIRVRDQVVAAAGVNWLSASLADMYVYTDRAFQGRGWGKAVGSACVGDLLAKRLLPLYTVSEQNTASRRLSEALGFRDSGARELECRGRLRQGQA